MSKTKIDSIYRSPAEGMELAPIVEPDRRARAVDAAVQVVRSQTARRSNGEHDRLSKRHVLAESVHARVVRALQPRVEEKGGGQVSAAEEEPSGLDDRRASIFGFANWGTCVPSDDRLQELDAMPPTSSKLNARGLFVIALWLLADPDTVTASDVDTIVMTWTRGDRSARIVCNGIYVTAFIGEHDEATKIVIRNSRDAAFAIHAIAAHVGSAGVE